MIRLPSDIAEAQALLRQLGYEIRPASVGPRAWPDGLARPAGRWWYAGSFGSLDIHLLDTDADADGEETLRGLTSWNSVRTQALVRVTPAESRLMVARHGRRIGALRLTGNRDPDEVLRRLESLRQRGRESRDPALLFEQALESDSTGRKFFQRFRAATERISAATAELTGAARSASDDHALLIMSRLLFLCFVQRKGWLSSDGDFLNRNITKASEDGSSIHTFLSTLFFGSLNTPAEQRCAAAMRLGRIPYLNGGLFEPSAFELLHENRLLLRDETLSGAFRGVFSVFDFSVHEDSEDATAIDPEMLGRVFEALMSSDERSASGSFYTPPAIVDRIVARTLVARLANSAVERSALQAALSGSGALRQLSGSARASLQARASALRILDPACGTGAFLLASLHALERLLAAPADDPCRSRAELRRRIVENQLFGIDRKAEAIRLCELRLWLSIVAAEDDVERLQPLPNLDRNIAHGDSLVSPLDAGVITDRTRVGRWRDRDPELEVQYRTASGETRRKLRRRLIEQDQAIVLDLIEREVEAVRRAPRQSRMDGGFESRPQLARLRRLRTAARKGILPFDWCVHFAEVAESGGFDLVVGNPPWVRRAALDPDVRRALQQRYSWFAGEGGKAGQGDLWVAFLQRFLQLCSEAGAIGILLPEKLLTSSYALPARRALVREHRLEWIERESRSSFDADTFPLALVAARHDSGAVRSTVEVEGFGVPPSTLSLSSDRSDRWLLVPPRVRGSLERISVSGPRLSSDPQLVPRMGVKTGGNRWFLREDVVAADEGDWMVDGVRVPAGGIVRLVRGRDLHPDGWRDGVWMLWPPGLVHMKRASLERLSARVGCDPSRLLSVASMPAVTDRCVVAWKDLGLRLNPVVLPPFTRWSGRRVRVVPSQTLYCIATRANEDAYAVTALLRSTPVAALAAALADPAKDRHRRYFGATIGDIPLPPSLRSGCAWKELSQLGRGAAKLTLPEIDRIIADAYSISRREVRELALWLSSELQGM